MKSRREYQELKFMNSLNENKEKGILKQRKKAKKAKSQKPQKTKKAPQKDTFW